MSHINPTTNLDSMEIIENQKRPNVDSLDAITTNKIFHGTNSSIVISSSNDSQNSQTSSTYQLLKFTFTENDIDFTIISWSDIKKSLTRVSTTWLFVSFADSHKSVIFKEKEQKSIDTFVQTGTITIKGIEKIFNFSICKVNSKTAIKGIIYNKFLIPIEEEVLKSALKSQGVFDIYKIQKVDLDGNKKCTGSVILSFSSNVIPDEVVFELVQLKVTRLNPRPMQCVHCKLLGHTIHNCTKKSRQFCNTCFYEHESNQPCVDNCKNCSEIHKSNDKKCPTYLKEIEILKYKEIHLVSYPQAKRLLDLSKPICDSEQLRRKEIDDIKKRFNKLNIELQNTRESEKKLLAQNNHLNKEIIPSLKQENSKLLHENSILSETIEKDQQKHLAEIESLFKSNTQTLQTLHRENLEYAEKLNKVQEEFNEMAEKVKTIKKSSQNTKDSFEAFIDFSVNTKKEYAKFYEKMSKEQNTNNLPDPFRKRAGSK